MKAVQMVQTGGPECLELRDVPEPEIRDDEVLVRVHVAGVNPVDAKIRLGQFTRFHPVVPAIIGRDISGVVVRAGRAVSEFPLGSEVLGVLDYDRGAYAEFVAASPREIAHKPHGLDHAQAAALPVAALTAWQALFEHGKLQADQSLLIHGASGGVGHYAVQFAAWCGAKVAATCAGSDRDFVKSLGAERAIDYRAERFEDIVSNLDLVLDLIGGETRRRSWPILRSGGILVSTLPDPAPEGRSDVSGREVVVYANSRQLEFIAVLVTEGHVKVHLDQVFPLVEARRAHLHLEKEHSRGKTVLRVLAEDKPNPTIG